MRLIVTFALTLSFPLTTHAEWLAQSSPVADASLRAIQPVSPKVVWASGSKGTVLRTVDGGRAWKVLAVPGAQLQDLRGLAAFSESAAVLISAGEASEGRANIYRTVDGGRTWALVFQSFEKGVFLDGVAFWDSQNGLVLGDPIEGKWFVLRTGDGGKTWKRIPPQSLPDMLAAEAAFAASNSSLIVQGRANAWIASGGAAHARIFRTTDRGATWSVVETPMPAGPTAGIFGLRFTDAKSGIAVGGDHKQTSAPTANTMGTTDAGATWHSLTPTDPPGLKESVVVRGDGTWIAVGPSGTGVSKDRGRTWRSGGTEPLHAAACWQNRCWAVGGKGFIGLWN